jgi:hypothetical protein
MDINDIPERDLDRYRFCNRGVVCAKCPLGMANNKYQMNCNRFAEKYKTEFYDVIAEWNKANPRENKVIK